MKRLLSTLFILLASIAFAQTVMKHPDPTQPLDARWQWAAAQSQKLAGNYWIAYSFDRTCRENETVGTWYGSGTRHPTIAEVLTGARQNLNMDHLTDHMVTKETAVLIEYKKGNASPICVQASDVSLYSDLHGEPLIWLGNADANQSIAFLKEMYSRSNRVDDRREIVSAIGLHKQPAATPFLKSVLTEGNNPELRGQAAYWLAAQNDPAILQYLEPILEKETSEEVIDEALAGLEDIDEDTAIKLLIDWSSEKHSMQLRKKAIFWLGQQSAELAVKRVKDAAYNDPDIEIEKQALYGIADMDDAKGIPELIEIARTHRNPEIRKAAIYMLGDSGDPRARAALIDIASGK